MATLRTWLKRYKKELKTELMWIGHQAKLAETYNPKYVKRPTKKIQFKITTGYKLKKAKRDVKEWLKEK